MSLPSCECSSGLPTMRGAPKSDPNACGPTTGNTRSAQTLDGASPHPDRQRRERGRRRVLAASSAICVVACARCALLKMSSAVVTEASTEARSDR